MRNTLFLWLSMMMVGLSCTTYAKPIYQAIDSEGNLIQLQHPAKRIVTLAPNLAEIVHAVGADKTIVGVSSKTDRLRNAGDKPIVATNSDLDIERIVALHPDLVIAWQSGNPHAQIMKLRSLSIPVYIAAFHHFSDIPKTALNIGHLTKHDKTAEKYVRTFMRHYAFLKMHYARKKPIATFYQLSRMPLMTLNNKSLVGQAIQLCGGKNIFGNTMMVAPRVSLSSILKANPHIIFISQQINHPNELSRFWQHYSAMTAVREGDIFLSPSKALERYSPKMLMSVDALCQKIDRVRHNGEQSNG